jgi:hypothetical protein
VDLMGPEESGTGRPRPCGKLVLALFGALFLIALLSVPVTTRTSRLRQDPASLVVFKTTYPRQARMFLPRYLAAAADPKRAPEVRLRAAEWLGTMAIIAALGLFDFAVVCRLLRKPAGPVPPA